MAVLRQDSDRKETRLALLRGFDTCFCHFLGTGVDGLLITISKAFPSPCFFLSAFFMDFGQY